jgi:hypothetical protein
MEAGDSFFDAMSITCKGNKTRDAHVGLGIPFYQPSLGAKYTFPIKPLPPSQRGGQ